ncbi:MAG: hypothetical protein ACRES8_00465 [Nevskiaceae bacterium]
MLLAGCAAWFPQKYAAEDHVAFLTQALGADAKGREAMWRNYGAGNGSEAEQLRVALLQSLPHHSGYDPAAARERLDTLATRTPASFDVAVVARLRLAEMGETAECRTETAELRQRLSRVVDIERRLNQDK